MSMLELSCLVKTTPRSRKSSRGKVQASRLRGLESESASFETQEEKHDCTQWQYLLHHDCRSDYAEPVIVELCTPSDRRAALGNEETIIGWYRDASCEPPGWNTQPVIPKQTITLTVSGAASTWQVDFYNTKTGTDMISSATVKQQDNTVTIALPDFTDDIAFKIHVQE